MVLLGKGFLSATDYKPTATPYGWQRQLPSRPRLVSKIASRLLHIQLNRAQTLADRASFGKQGNLVERQAKCSAMRMSDMGRDHPG
jgi:hypothetical protein